MLDCIVSIHPFTQPVYSIRLYRLACKRRPITVFTSSHVPLQEYVCVNCLYQYMCVYVVKGIVVTSSVHVQQCWFRWCHWSRDENVLRSDFGHIWAKTVKSRI